MNTNQKSQKPYVVEGEGDKAYWTKIGGAWRHDDGKSFNIQLSCMPLNGRLAVREPKDQGRRGGGAMSPAATRRYVVGFSSWMMYEAIVLASSKREAIAKAKALYDLNGLGDFSIGDSGEEPWHARRRSCGSVYPKKGYEALLLARARGRASGAALPAAAPRPPCPCYPQSSPDRQGFMTSMNACGRKAAKCFAVSLSESDCVTRLVLLPRPRLTVHGAPQASAQV